MFARRVISRLCKQSLVKPSFPASLSRGFGFNAENKAQKSDSADMSANKNQEVLDKVRTDESKDFTEQSNMQAFREEAVKKINKAHMKTDECAGPECDTDHTAQTKTMGQQRSTNDQGTTTQSQQWTAREQEKTMGQNRSQTSTRDQQQDKTMSQKDFNTREGNTAKKDAWTKDQDKTMQQDWSKGQDKTMKQDQDKTMKQDWNKDQNQQTTKTQERTMTDSNDLRGRDERTGQKDMKGVDRSTNMTEENLKNDLFESRGKKMDSTSGRTQATMKDTASMSNTNLNSARSGADTVNDAKMSQNTQMKSDSKLNNTQSNAGIGAESLNPGKTEANKFNDTTIKAGTTSDFMKKESDNRSNRWSESSKLADTKSKTDSTTKTDQKTEKGEKVDESSWGL